MMKIRRIMLCGVKEERKKSLEIVRYYIFLTCEGISLLTERRVLQLMYDGWTSVKECLVSQSPSKS
jgi:hypothetical protein